MRDPDPGRIDGMVENQGEMTMVNLETDQQGGEDLKGTAPSAP